MEGILRSPINTPHSIHSEDWKKSVWCFALGVIYCMSIFFPDGEVLIFLAWWRILRIHAKWAKSKQSLFFPSIMEWIWMSVDFTLRFSPLRCSYWFWLWSLHRPKIIIDVTGSFLGPKNQVACDTKLFFASTSRSPVKAGLRQVPPRISFPNWDIASILTMCIHSHTVLCSYQQNLVRNWDPTELGAPVCLFPSCHHTVKSVDLNWKAFGLRHLEAGRGQGGFLFS